MAHCLPGQEGEQSGFTLTGGTYNTAVRHGRIFTGNMELETVSRAGGRAEHGNGARTPVTLGETFRRFVKGNGGSHHAGQITISPRQGLISRKLVKEGRLGHPAFAHRRYAEQTADTLDFAFGKLYFLQSAALEQHRHRIFGQRLVVGIAVFNGGQHFTVLVNHIAGETGHGCHPLLLHEQSAGMGLKNRADIVQQHQLAVN